MNAVDIDIELQRRRELVESAQENLFRLAGAARADLPSFFSFVIREEVTRKRIECLPMQRVIFRFVEHFERCVLRMPPGFGKTYAMAAFCLRRIGIEPTTRGVVISASQAQSQKVVSMVSDYIETSHELHLVYPGLRPSPRESDPWTQTQITVDRPPGIRDPSLSAVGLHGKLPGARLNWILIDDLLTEENTATAELCQVTNRWVGSTVLSRRDIRGTKIITTNTSWHPKDLTYTLEKAGWPTLSIDIYGDIVFKNTCADDMTDGLPPPLEGDFDTDDIRPSDVNPKSHRLTAHDHPRYNPAGPQDGGEWRDKQDVVPIWPERYGVDEIAKLKKDYVSDPKQFDQLYRNRPRGESSKVKEDWFEKCKRAAREAGIYDYATEWDTNDGPTFTGVDIGVGEKPGHDRTAIFTFALLPDMRRRILRIDSGNWLGNTTIELLGLHHAAFHSIIRVENNAAQDFLRQWALQMNVSLPLRGAPTGRNKWSRDHGIESVLIEVDNGAWLVPNDASGSVHEAVQRWADGIDDYDPTKHTSDELLACWLAREQARASGFIRTADRDKISRDRKRVVARLAAR